MNKERMGQFLSQLRKEYVREDGKKGLTMSELAAVFNQKYFETTPATISNWEKGKSIPDLDNLTILSEFFGVPIEEILDGSRKEDIRDFKTEVGLYFIDDPDYKYSPQRANSFFEAFKNQRKYWRELTIKYINEGLTKTEKLKLEYLANELFGKHSSQDLFEMYRLLDKIKNSCLDKEEQWWRIQHFIPSEEYLVKFADHIANGHFLEDESLDYFSLMEDWEKDFYLSILQIYVPVSVDIDDDWDSEKLRSLEMKYGVPFDSESLFKALYHYLVKSGAQINNNYLLRPIHNNGEDLNINVLEKAFKFCKKPLSFIYKENQKEYQCYVENTPTNYLVLHYGNTILLNNLLESGYDFKEMVEIISENQTVPEEVFRRVLENCYGICDPNKKIEYLVHDAEYDTRRFSDYWSRANDELVKYFINLEDEKTFSEDIKNGIAKAYYFSRQIPKPTFTENVKRVQAINQKISCQQFKEGRNKKLTRDLDDKLDGFNVTKIQNLFLEE